jgi:hypothetical protein
LTLIYRTYMLGAVIVLSMITSMGIFGFLSDAYQTSFAELSIQQIKVDSLKAQQTRNLEEIGRINRSIDMIPDNRVSQQIIARQRAEPLIRELVAKNEAIAEQFKLANLKTLDIKTKAGPLVYVAQLFHEEIDTVVKWLILVFVSVFDPLAICLVIATSKALSQKAQNAQTAVALATQTQEFARARLPDFIEKADPDHASGVPKDLPVNLDKPAAAESLAS